MLLQVLILREVDLLHDLLAAFTDAGVQGSTVLDCDGALQVLGQASDDAPPIFASLRKFMNPDQERNKLVLTAEVKGTMAQDAEVLKAQVEAQCGKAHVPDILWK